MFVRKVSKIRIINFLDLKYWDRMHDGVSGLVEKYLFQLKKMSWWKDGKSLIQEMLNKKVEWNLKWSKVSTVSLSDFPFMERMVIQSSHPRALKTYYFFCLLTFFRPPCLKSEHKVSFFIFGSEGHRKVFCILSSSPKF